MIERLKFLRDYFNGDLPITQSINSAQVVEILDAVIKPQPTAEVEPSCELIKKINILLLNFAQHEYYNEIAEILNECKRKLV